ncbi:hypothetical protein W97_05046 [Coniosporium apollinis CBS 100218]|uniref:Uncharacterized protein n=1 Tax=Coniosporium apollinis (strain CBS 100218) TaxID=1168221 RepID=R7YV73_CONA1|nr:uncharacterized protein W97_05046 [Coniosporium apollinis CBS 100218]EON65807.1 hypothetical protein W97_05046 [Coniosporium apollinis CBS 100218]
MILRDLANKVINWLDKFKAAGDIVVNYDPSHLALPWAGVRFILQAAVADSQQMGNLLVGMEKVTCLMSRGTIYENFYLHMKHGTNPNQAVNNLQDALVKLYAKVLQFLAGANRLYNKNTASRAIHAILNPDEVHGFIKDCQPLEDRVNIEASNCEHMYTHEALSELGKQMKQLRQLLDDINKPIVRIDPRIAALWDRSNADEHSQILLWTSDIPYEGNHKTAKEGRAKDTGQWLLTHAKYSRWRNSSASMILWLHGIPGAGKTKLASTVVDDMLSTLTGQQNDEALAYFYCDRNQASRQEPVSVMRSFVRQLSTARTGDAMHPLLVQRYQQKRQIGFASGPLDANECEDLLLKYVNDYPHTTLILDALDECDHRTRKHLIVALDRIVGSSSKPIKVFISSRPDLDIRERFETGPNVGIQATDNQNDIARFVDARLDEDDKSRRKKFTIKLKEDIRDTLLEKSQGMFQWASLQITQILELSREKDIRCRLGRLPEGLTKAYDEIWEMMKKKPGSSFEIAERAFKWVMCSRTPLSPDLLVAAVCQDPETENMDQVDVDIDYVLAACSNLLVIDPQLSVCRFSHLSVQEYIENHRLKPIQAEDVVARVCLRLLCDDSINKSGIKPADWSYQESAHWSYQKFGQYKIYKEHQDDNIEKGVEKLLNYARLYWPNHVQDCEQAEDIEMLSAVLMNFLGSMNESGAAYRAWHTALLGTHQEEVERCLGWEVVSKLSPPSSAAFAICYFGLYRVLSAWWDVGLIDSNQCNLEAESLLALSAANGFLPICRRLIELGANVNSGNEDNLTVLHNASYSGQEEIVELLLDHGANVNAQSEDHTTALYNASLTGHGKVIELLLYYDADVNAQTERHTTALRNASLKGHEKIAELLLDHGADVNHQSTYTHNTALHIASLEGHKKIVELLLKKGANVHARDWLHRTALHEASERGHTEIRRLLLDWGAEEVIEESSSSDYSDLSMDDDAD